MSFSLGISRNKSSYFLTISYEGYSDDQNGNSRRYFPSSCSLYGNKGPTRHPFNSYW
uniref:ORF56a n=1 Tax=Pinus koraiensis TaxID=88728 RepID=A4QMI6_PINKO|nr:ORF56a [Pinus koraiensis]ABP35364.1 ORF56a [Pinus koraiensis]